MADIDKMLDDAVKGYKPDPNAKAAPASGNDDWKVWQQNGTPGAPQDEGNHGLSEFITSPHGLIRTGARQAAGGVKKLFTPGQRQAGLSDVIEGGGRTLAPVAMGATLPALVTAPGATLGGLAVGAGTGMALSKTAGGLTSLLGGSPETTRLVEDAAPLIAGGQASRWVGKGLQRLAQPFVRLGLKLPPGSHDYGAQPEEAALRLTKGTDPAEIERQANTTIGNLTNQRNAALSSAGSRGVKVPLAPSRALVNAGIQNQQAGNDIPREMMPIKEHFEVPHTGFAGAVHQPPTPMIPNPNSLSINAPLIPGPKPPARVADLQPPMDFQGMKQILQQRFTNFKPGESSREAVDLANQVHHQMGSDLERAVPGTAPLNKDIQSLIPVAKRGHATALNAGPLENAVDAATRPTGRLAAPFVAGTVGGLPAAAATFGAQQALANPRNMLRMARALYGMGGQSNAARNVARILPLTLQDNGEYR